MQEEPVPEGAKYRFAEFQLLPVGGATDKAAAGAWIHIGSAPVESLQRLIPKVGPTASKAVALVNQIFTSDELPSSQSHSAYSCQAAMKWKFDAYEMVTTIKGQSQYTELQNSFMRCIDDCTDQEILSSNLLLPANEHAEWYAVQTKTFESFRKPAGQIVDENVFLQHYLHAFEAQLHQGTHELGAHWLDSLVPFTHRDRQGRLWNATWEERCCLTDQGAFCHAARKIHLWSPRCLRAWQVVTHFNWLAGGTNAPAPVQDSSPAIPIVGSMEIRAVSAELPRSKDFSDIVDKVQTTGAPDLLEDLFDFDGIFESMPQGKMSKRRATLSSCSDLSVQHSHPPLSPQDSESHTFEALPASLSYDSDIIDDLFRLCGLKSGFVKVAADSQMKLDSDRLV